MHTLLDVCGFCLLGLVPLRFHLLNTTRSFKGRFPCSARDLLLLFLLIFGLFPAIMVRGAMRSQLQVICNHHLSVFFLPMHGSSIDTTYLARLSSSRLRSASAWRCLSVTLFDAASILFARAAPICSDAICASFCCSANSCGRRDATTSKKKIHHQNR